MNTNEIIERLVKEIYYSFSADHIANIPKLDNAIKEAEAYLKTGGWHRWPEEKPEKDGVYLVRLNLKGEPFDTLTTNYRRESAINYRWMISLDATVTHWQPLPALPKEEE